MRKTLTGRAFPAIWIGIYIAGLLFFLLVPFEFLKDKSFCVIYHLFGVRCPGCGMTRAVSSVFHGNPAKALEYNRLVAVVLPLLTFLMLEDGFRVLLRRIRHKKLVWGDKQGASLVERAIMRLYRNTE